jgi:hypothetical protein
MEMLKYLTTAYAVNKEIPTAKCFGLKVEKNVLAVLKN